MENAVCVAQAERLRPAGRLSRRDVYQQEEALQESVCLPAVLTYSVRLPHDSVLFVYSNKLLPEPFTLKHTLEQPHAAIWDYPAVPLIAEKVSTLLNHRGIVTETVESNGRHHIGPFLIPMEQKEVLKKPLGLLYLRSDEALEASDIDLQVLVGDRLAILGPHNVA